MLRTAFSRIVHRRQVNGEQTGLECRAERRDSERGSHLCPFFFQEKPKKSHHRNGFPSEARKCQAFAAKQEAPGSIGENFSPIDNVFGDGDHFLRRKKQRERSSQGRRVSTKRSDDEDDDDDDGVSIVGPTPLVQTRNFSNPA